MLYGKSLMLINIERTFIKAYRYEELVYSVVQHCYITLSVFPSFRRRWLIISRRHCCHIYNLEDVYHSCISAVGEM